MRHILKFLTIATTVITMVSCATMGHNVPIYQNFELVGDNLNITLQTIDSGIKKLHNDGIILEPKDKSNVIAVVSLLWTNTGTEPILHNSLPVVELLLSSDGRFQYIPVSATIKDPTPTIGAYEIPQGDKPNSLAPDKKLNKHFAYAIPSASEIIAVSVNRIVNLDVVSSDHPDYEKYLDWASTNRNAAMVFNATRLLGYPEIRSLMDMHRIDFSITDIQGNNIFQHALTYGNMSVVQGLLLDGANREISTPLQSGGSGSPILVAVQSGNVALVDWMVQNNFDIREQSSDNRSAFEIAVRNSSLDMMHYLIELGFNPDEEKIRMAWGRSMSPLAYAKQVNLSEVVEYLRSIGVAE